MNLTTNNISFLKDVPSDIKVDLTSGWRYYYFQNLDINEISSFINWIGDDRVFLLIPLIANSKSFSIATLNLSESFLVNNKSNPVLIIRFIKEQWQSSGFDIKEDALPTFSFKMKRVWFSSHF
jgi:hypothetical protein